MRRIQLGLGKHLIIDAYGIEEKKLKDFTGDQEIT